MKNYNEIAGLVSEKELDTLLEDEITGGATPITPATPTIVGTAIEVAVVVTLAWKYCPTTGCTYSCRF
ncbi:MAG: hypothetical protein E7500_05845 [Ruminococcus sp.]|nr:hypothetical protein [Ruminococcus sp.]